MLACGTGIAPMVQVARAIVENEDEETVLRCIYACRTQQDILLKDQLDQFKTFWNFRITYALSNSTAESLLSNPGRIRYGDEVYHGRIDRELVEREMSGFLPDVDQTESTVLICGTKSFDKDMINILHKSGCTKNSYFKF